MDFRIKKVNILFCKCFLLFILLFVSCKKVTRPLELSDLKFNQVDWYSMIYNDKEILAANQIDTMFLILDPNSEINSYSTSWYNGIPYQTDTVGYYVYDDNGRILETQLFTLFVPNDKYQYDSVGLLKEYRHESDYGDRQEISHRFVPDSLLLYQYRYYDLKPEFEIKFKFDKQGKILEEKGGWIKNSDYYSRTIYEYNHSGKPVYMQTKEYEGGKEVEGGCGYRNYFYTNDKLDSIYIVLSIIRGGIPDGKPMKLYYDERGLCYLKDSGYGRIINCVYKQRERN